MQKMLNFEAKVAKRRSRRSLVKKKEKEEHSQARLTDYHRITIKSNESCYLIVYIVIIDIYIATR
jgi:hypothetical protein